VRRCRRSGGGIRVTTPSGSTCLDRARDSEERKTLAKVSERGIHSVSDGCTSRWPFAPIRPGSGKSAYNETRDLVLETRQKGMCLVGRSVCTQILSTHTAPATPASPRVSDTRCQTSHTSCRRDPYWIASTMQKGDNYRNFDYPFDYPNPLAFKRVAEEIRTRSHRRRKK
jgi:hypothetical protein